MPAVLAPWAEYTLFAVTALAGIVGIIGGIAGFRGRSKAVSVEIRTDEIEAAYKEAMREIHSRQAEAQEALVKLRQHQAEFETAYREGMEKLQRRQADAQERIAAAVAESVRKSVREPAKVEPKGATLSMRVRKSGRHSYKLVISNRGPGPAQVLDVQSLSDPNMLVGDLGLDNLVLHPGEDHEILAAPSLATPQHPKVLVTWLDDMGTHRREQSVGL